MRSFTSLIVALTAITSFSFAAPTPAPVSTVSKTFKLKTQVYAGNEDFNNQYLVTYHTGAGMNAPTFTKSTDGSTGYLNGTVAVFNFATDYKVILAMGATEDFYAEWGPLTLNIAGTTSAGPPEPSRASGFEIGPDGFFTHIKSDTQNFTGWRVCNWVHGVPELFFDTAIGGSDLPTSCARVYLVPEYV